MMIVGGLTALLILSVAVLLGMGKSAPTGLTTVIGSGLGSLATLLVNNRGDGKQ